VLLASYPADDAAGRLGRQPESARSEVVWRREHDGAVDFEQRTEALSRLLDQSRHIVCAILVYVT
jgi:hypothetical protein